MSASGIPYATESWNPLRTKDGRYLCTPVSPGCRKCWARSMMRRFHREAEVGPLLIDEREVRRAMHWHKRRVATVQFMGDLCHSAADMGVIRAVLLACGRHMDQHTWLICTKRPHRLRDVVLAMLDGAAQPNLWYGTTCEDQGHAARRLADLGSIASTGRNCWASFEPLLGPIDLGARTIATGRPIGTSIRWAVIGCESGPGAASCDIEWVRDLVKQCRDYKVQVYVKQLRIDGRFSAEPAEWPEDLRLREIPWREPCRAR